MREDREALVSSFKEFSLRTSTSLLPISFGASQETWCLGLEGKRKGGENTEAFQIFLLLFT